MATIYAHPTNGLPVYVDSVGVHRVLGRLAPTKKSERKSFAEFLSATGVTVIPRANWKPFQPPEGLDTKFITNQYQCSGCVGFSGAQAYMRCRARRGLTFYPLSGAFLYSNINGGFDGGAMIDDAMTSLEQAGTCLQSTMDYPKIFTRQAPSTASAEAARFKLEEAYTISSLDEVATAIQLGFIVQIPIEVAGNFESFNSEGVAGNGGSGGNHSVHVIGMQPSTLNSGQWIFRMPNSWGTSFGPFNNGTCFLSEGAAGACLGQGDAFVHVAPALDPQDPLNPVII